MRGVRVTGAGPPLVALHGFTHTGAQFDWLAPHVKRTVVAPDLPGHGFHADAATDLTSVLDLVAEVIGSVSNDAVPVVGYSQGGRIGLSVAHRERRLVAQLVLIGATPGIADAGARSERRAADVGLANEIRDLGIERFLDHWTGTGITSTRHRPSDVRAADDERRRANTADGLARAILGYGQGIQPPLWDELVDIDIPTLIVTGEHDDRYTAIGHRMAHRMPDASLVVIPQAGHDPMADQPGIVGPAISAFLDGKG